MAIMAACAANPMLTMGSAASSLLHTSAAIVLTNKEWSHRLRWYRMPAVVCLRCYYFLFGNMLSAYSHAVWHAGSIQKPTCCLCRACSAAMLECVPFPGIASLEEALCWQFLAKPALLVTSCLGMRLPLAQNMLLQAACLVPALVRSSHDCAQLSAIAGSDRPILSDFAQASRQNSFCCPQQLKICCQMSVRHAGTLAHILQRPACGTANSLTPAW